MSNATPSNAVTDQAGGRPSLPPGSAAFIAIVASMMTMTAMTIDINLPAIPATSADLGADLGTAQLAVPVFFMGFAVGQVFWGPVSDRTGRKPAIIAGILLYIASSIACAMADSIETLLWMRALQGLGGGGGSVMGRTMVRDRFTGQAMARVMSLAMAAFVTAPIVGPSVGAAILAVADWRAIFWFLVLYGGVLLVVAWRFLDETLKAPDPGALSVRRIAKGYSDLFGDPASRRWALVVVLGFVPLNVYLTNASAVFMSSSGMSASEFGLVFAVVASFSAMGNLTNARLVRSLPLERTLLIGLTGGAAAAALNLVMWSTTAGGWWLVPGFCGFFFCFGLIIANGSALALQPHGRNIGTVVSALGVAQTVFPALVASLVALVFAGHPLAAIGTMLTALVLGAIVHLTTPKPAAEPHG